MRRAFWGLTVFIVASFLAMALVLFYLAHQGLHGALEDMVRRDLAMTMSVAQGALAQRDYERVEEQVLLWGERDPNIVTFRVVLDDDNLLVAYVRDRQEQHTLQIAQEVLTPAGRTARFEMVYDLTKHRHQTRLLALLFLGFSACGTALFVFSLWMILQRLAIRPLQGEIEERRRAERALRESRERLGLALQGADLGTWDWNVATGAVATVMVFEIDSKTDLENGQQCLLLAPQILNLCFHLGEALAKYLLVRLVAIPCQQIANVTHRNPIRPETNDLR